jgi:hypothetical protein
MPVIPALRRQRQENFKFNTRLGYILRPCLKNEKKKKKLRISATDEMSK